MQNSAKQTDTTQNGVQPYESPIRRAPKKFNFWRGIYNKDKNYILGRTPKNWGQLFIFYSIFYAVLALLFAICMWGLYRTLDEKTPRWLLDESRIGGSPGLGFRPLPANISQGSLIWYSPTNETTVKEYVERIDQFLAEYVNQTVNPPANSVNCNFGNPPPPGKVCRVSLGQFGECTQSTGYGFKIGKPCIFLKLNRIINWTPQQFNLTNDADFPHAMPQEVRNTIKSLPTAEKQQVFISCQGQYPKDREVISKITISPNGLPAYYYPYTNEANYLSPLVAAQFDLKKRGEIVNIECIAWAPNIKYKGGDNDRQGSIHLEILLD